ncbi:hypothetical protein IC575_002794 [Cucumis melo]|uniref:Pentatricopeptide repeat-containing protein At3g15930 isoform X1 n=2 Tax=Cucumis melo TaxID=3656 RepID=A0A1S3CDK0_CUCME|nr:putative pentatricopeptide repeat-containing protein At3g15930 isoform X1 [Cucumis melo]
MILEVNESFDTFMPVPVRFRTLLHRFHVKESKQMPTIAATSSASKSFSPPTRPLIYLLETCKSMDQLQQVHCQAIKTGLNANPVLQNRVMSFCCTDDYGDFQYARHLFDEIPEPNLFIWNTMIRGYSRLDFPQLGVSLYLEMLRRGVKPDRYTFPFLFKGFTRDIALEYGRQLHGHVLKHGLQNNVFVHTALVQMYLLCGQLDTARGVLDVCSKADVITWNMIISAYNKVGKFEESRRLFLVMENKQVLATTVTLVLVLSACSKLKDLRTGKKVHSYVKNCKVESNLVLENALIDMYADCGEMDSALGIFRSMNNRDIISWTTIVSGFTNLGEIDVARNYFDKMPEKDYVSWTAMIDGYIRSNRFKEALELFRNMQATNVKPDEFTMVSVLTACAHLGALELGEWIRTYINRNKINNDLFVRNALIDMYFKCGDVDKAERIFREMSQRDKFTWTAMIVGLAVNGHGEKALDMFSNMLKASILPDEITYIGVLSACTHTGLVDKGRKYFLRMTSQHGIEPNIAHYGCLVDLLARAGRLKEAYDVIKNMPIKANSIVWGALLAGCRVYREADMAEMVVKHILELEPDNGAVYVLLCNIYAACKRWNELRELRQMMMDKGIKKTPGCSLIEMNGRVHEFVAGDRSHPQTKNIDAKLDKMTQDLKLAGYSPDISEVFLDVAEEDKENSVFRHSEKLAIAFGLINSPPGVTIRITKNLRMCMDCHNMAKLVSKVYNREVIVRDRTRFHHFKHGLCSCKDYW